MRFTQVANDIDMNFMRKEFRSLYQTWNPSKNLVGKSWSLVVNDLGI
jgi:hypothetical protein